MTRYYALALTTTFWKPGTDYKREIMKVTEGRIRDGDFLVVSEKAISTATGNIVDESNVTPGFSAKFLASFWMPLAWGYFLGVACHFGKRLLRRIRQYPAEEGSRHKQITLQYAGFGQSLMFGSEGGIDGSNLPFSLMSLPLEDVHLVAEAIRADIQNRLFKRVTVLVADTDKTYSIRNFYFTPRPKPLKGISSHCGVAAYVAGRMLRLHKRPTPLAVAGERLSVEEALTVANVADRARGPGSGATVWDMAARFKVAESAVTWEMLEAMKHKPVVIVRRAARKAASRQRGFATNNTNH